MTTYFLIGRKLDQLVDNLDIPAKDYFQRVRTATQRMVEQINDKLRES